MSGLDVSKIFTEGNTAVITGASSGIGRAAAIYCAKIGMHVWMIDVDQEDLSTALQVVQSNALYDNDSDSGMRQLIQDVIADVSIENDMNNTARRVFEHDTTKSVHFRKFFFCLDAADYIMMHNG